MGMSSFWLKIIACASMLLDHLSYALPERASWMNVVGRIAFPIFAFQLAQGYSHTRDFNRYALRLASFAVLSQFPFMLLMRMTGGSEATLNIFFTLFIGLMAVRAYDTLPCKPAVLIMVVLGSAVADLINTDYGAWGVVLVFLFHVAGKDKFKQAAALLLMAAARYGVYIIRTGDVTASCIAFCLSLVFILLHNGNKGWNVKYLLYVFYPAHLIILYALNRYAF